MFLPLAAIPFIIIYIIYQSVLKALPRVFLVPPQGWQLNIQEVIDHPRPIYLKAGWKRSSFRRRLITASFQPSFYTNYVSNKIKLLPEDSENVNNEFILAMKSRDPKDPNRKRLLGFFHPYANNGGGGEKVLWQSVEATLQENERSIAVIYTTNTDAKPLEILAKANQKFNIRGLDEKRIVFIYLRRFSALIDGAYWRHFTLIGQLFGSVLLGLEAIYELSPDVWIDTIGLPGSYWLVKWILKIPIVAYVHYPIIQPDMFNKLRFKSIADLMSFKPNPADAIQAGKFIYWSTISLLYTFLGSCVDLTMVNGSWTFEHIKNIWYMNDPKAISIVYPPCSTEALTCSDLSTDRENKLLYIAQFRPEKRHKLIVTEVKKFLGKLQETKTPVSRWPKVVFLGSCKTKDDSSVLELLRTLVLDLELKENIEFIVDCPFEDVRKALNTCKFGLNAMWNEHFGIGVVEYLSSGVIPIVHASGGPLLDILSVDGPSRSWKNNAGFFFKSETDPDYNGVSENGCLLFEIQGSPLFYPELGQLLETIFIKDTSEISAYNLSVKRETGAAYVKEKFSNRAFNDAWEDRMKMAEALEVIYRTQRRDKVCAVY